MRKDIEYIDCNATTPAASQALEAMLRYLVEHFGNPSPSQAKVRLKLSISSERSQMVAHV